MTNQNDNIWQSSFLREAVFVIGAGGFLAAAGVFETQIFPWPVRLSYWVGLIGIGVWIGKAITAQLDPMTARLPWVGRWIIGATAISAPMVGMVVLAQGMVGYPIQPSVYANLATKVWLITAGVTAFRMRHEGGDGLKASVENAPPAPQADQPASAEASDLEPSPLSSRLPPALRASEIWALSAEDHYVRVYTQAGDDLVLIRFADAVSEVKGAEGMQVHRSWWVARSGVEHVQKRTEGGVVLLKNGVKAPVSRRRFPSLNAKGWP